VSRRGLLAGGLGLLATTLAGCGRKGPPEKPGGADEKKKAKE